MNHAIRMLKSELLDLVAEKEGIEEIFDTELEGEEITEYKTRLKITEKNIKDIRDVLKKCSKYPDAITVGNDCLN